MSLEASKKAVSPSIGILVVEDFEPLRQLICNLLRNWSQHAIVDETGDGLESVERARELQPDLVLIDIGLPKLNGIEAAKQIRFIAHNSKIVFVSQECSIEIVREAIRLGAHGYVHKADVYRDLVPAVEAVLAGKQFVSCGLPHGEGESISSTQD
jgi:DNA-binding NarL/FixJ family response regulator